VKSPIATICLKISGLLLLSNLVFVSTYAAENPWFVELGVGVAEIDSRFELQPDEFSFCPYVTSVPLCSTTVYSGFESDSTAKLNLGYYVRDSWGISFGYQSFGEFGSKLEVVNTPWPFQSGTRPDVVWRDPIRQTLGRKR